MNSFLKTLRRPTVWLAGMFGAAPRPVRIEQATDLGTNAADPGLEVPGQYKTCKGQVFRHGMDPSPDHESLDESRWIAYDGVRLRVSLYKEQSGATPRLTFCGKDADGCSEARDWAARLQRANGVWFPRQEVFADFCRELGWSAEAVEVMLGIYRT